MAKLSTYRRIFKEDYSQENQEDIDKLSVSLNDSFEEIYAAIDHQITFTENINCTIGTITVTVNSSSQPTVPVVVKLNSFQKNVIGIIPIRAVSVDSPLNIPTSGIYIDYSVNNAAGSSAVNKGNGAGSPFTININYIKGLITNKAFVLTFLII